MWALNTWYEYAPAVVFIPPSNDFIFGGTKKSDSCIFKREDLSTSFGHNSTISNPTIFFSLKTCFKKSNVSYQSKPPGSGVPVLGIIEGSKASKSNVINTVSVICSIAKSIHESSIAIS